MPTDDTPAVYTTPRGPGSRNGRPHYVIGAKGLKIIEELSARGCHLTTIAKALRMSVDAFKACRARQPEVEEAYQRGWGTEHDALVSNLRAAADTGNVVADIFLLKARHAYREGEPLEVNVSVNAGGVLVVPADMTVEEYLARKAEAGEIDPMPIRDVTPGRHYTPPEAIEHLPEAPIPGTRPEEAAPAPRRTPSGTRLERGD